MSFPEVVKPSFSLFLFFTMMSVLFIFFSFLFFFVELEKKLVDHLLTIDSKHWRNIDHLTYFLCLFVFWVCIVICLFYSFLFFSDSFLWLHVKLIFFSIDWKQSLKQTTRQENVFPTNHSVKNVMKSDPSLNVHLFLTHSTSMNIINNSLQILKWCWTNSLFLFRHLLL